MYVNKTADRLALALVLALIAIFLFPACGTDTPTFYYSPVPNRADARELDNAVVTSPLYAFFETPADVTAIDFYVDDPGMTGPVFKTESIPPFDLAGTSDATGLGVPVELGPGEHVVTARVRIAGKDPEITSASFTVAGALTPTPVAPTATSAAQTGRCEGLGDAEMTHCLNLWTLELNQRAEQGVSAVDLTTSDLQTLQTAWGGLVVQLDQHLESQTQHDLGQDAAFTDRMGALDSLIDRLGTLIEPSGEPTETQVHAAVCNELQRADNVTGVGTVLKGRLLTFYGC